jgi:hypothetical protein
MIDLFLNNYYSFILYDKVSRMSSTFSWPGREIPLKGIHSHTSVNNMLIYIHSLRLKFRLYQHLETPRRRQGIIFSIRHMPLEIEKELSLILLMELYSLVIFS